MQIESRIDQDRTSPKTSLYGTSRVHGSAREHHRSAGGGGFLYVESIYIQATEARMPQLKKVVLAMGDKLIYRDTFDQALADLTAAPMSTAVSPVTAVAPSSQPTPPTLAERLRQLRDQAEQLTRELDKLQKDAARK